MTQGEVESVVGRVVVAHAGREGPLLPMLHDIQHQLGFVPPAAIPLLAEALRTTAAEVYGVVSFYHDFKDSPPGRHVLKICRAESCQAMGGKAVADEVQRRLGIGWGETTPDGRLTLEAVYCLGLCSCSPNAMLDDQVLGRVDADGLVAAVGEAR